MVEKTDGKYHSIDDDENNDLDLSDLDNLDDDLEIDVDDDDTDAGDDTVVVEEEIEEEAEGEKLPAAESTEESAEAPEKETRAERRISQLTAARKAAEEAQQATYAALEEERKQRETLVAKLAEHEKKTADTELDGLKAKRVDLHKQIEEARFETDHDTVATLQASLDDLNLDIGLLKSRPAPKVETQTDTPAPVPQVSQIPEEQKEWLKTNGWFNQPTDRAHRRAKREADKIYLELLEDGYTADDPDLYDELSKELKSKGYDFNPEPAEAGNDERKPLQTSMVNRSSVTTGTAAPPSKGNGKARQKITKFDLQLMAQMNLNPNSQKDRRTYLNADKGLI